jgi:4'-phosphopantetheinyl transferase
MKDLGWSNDGHGWHNQAAQISQPVENEVHLHYLEFEPWLHLVSYFSDWLSQDEQERVARLRFADGRDRFILSHAYTRSVLACYLGIHPREVEFKTSSTGKPWVSHHAVDNFGFNLSHCKTYVAIAVAPTPWIGVDIEDHRPQVDALGIAKRYFTQPEADSLHNLPPEEVEQRFLQLWTCKEAFVKAIGLGLSYSLNRFEVEGLQSNEPKFIGIEPDHGPSSIWSLKTHKPSLESHIAIAVKLPNAVLMTYC